MRDIFHKTKEILKGRGKIITIHEHAQDKECISDVCKNFIYLAQETDHEDALHAPQVHIRKFFDSLNRDEKFSMRVKGFFYVNRNRRLIKVCYYHTLKILLHWKSAIISPKKSVTMA
ncbi:MAG: hypothetical protein HY209_00775 [Candidatus Omnitrophica bacterium]|nr:hypothetical protein [Candidatus Omnitrophota bacterium]